MSTLKLVIWLKKNPFGILAPRRKYFNNATIKTTLKTKKKVRYQAYHKIGDIDKIGGVPYSKMKP